MNIKEARLAIEAILAAIPDDELPEFDKVEIDNDRGETLVWWGGSGRVLGSAMRGDVRNPIQYRKSGSWDAIQMEMTYRADQKYLENGDKPDGIRLAKKMVSA
jgi:hypothetical protein